MLRFIILYCLSFLALPYGFTQESTPLKNQKPIASISTSLQQWNNQQRIKLQKHQLVPIDYLSKHPEIKGLIINHYLGTGKTYLAIGFAERNQDRPVIILAPSFLESHWMEHLEQYGVKDKSRYRFFSHNHCKALAKEDVSQAIVIVDESHRFIERVRSQNQNDSIYSSIYVNLRKAHRILALSGTPIYNDIFDLIYQINLVAGKNILPFNQETFRLTYSKINKPRAYWRGHLLESYPLNHLLLPSAPLILNYYTSNEWILAGGTLGILITPLLLKLSTPPRYYPLRTFTPEKLKPIITKYISYYNFDHDSHSYPGQSSYTKELFYNSAQLHLLYKLYDSQLDEAEFTQIIKDSSSAATSNNAFEKDKMLLNNSTIQDHYKTQSGSGREIGNLSFIEKINSPQTKEQTKTIIFPEKFKQVLSTIERSQGPVVVYSHYYYNGLLLFKQFLDASGYKNQYRIFHPAMPKEKHKEIIQAFNKNQIKILLLHPDITEGISLKGTRQLHFLEMPINKSLQRQIIGRAIRYQSHQHLPKNEQHVRIYIWKYGISWFDIKTWIKSRENWHHNFAEFNYYSELGGGRISADPNNTFKSYAPDTIAAMHLNTLSKDISLFREYAKIFSIENDSYRSASIG